MMLDEIKPLFLESLNEDLGKDKIESLKKYGLYEKFKDSLINNICNMDYADIKRVITYGSLMAYVDNKYIKGDKITPTYINKSSRSIGLYVSIKGNSNLQINDVSDTFKSMKDIFRNDFTATAINIDDSLKDDEIEVLVVVFGE